MDIVQIKGHIKEYEWGNTSFIPALLGVPEDGKAKAELWFGTHPSGDAIVMETNQNLSSFLKGDSDHWFGEDHIESFGDELPLLFKVLAIEKPLSIQVHPDKLQAKAGWEWEEIIRKRLPQELWNYKDPNRKAEVIYALTPITAMCGFRPLDQIVPVLKLLLPEGYVKHFSYLDESGVDDDEKLARLFKQLYIMNKETLSSLIDEYIASLKTHEELPTSTADGRFLESKGIVLASYVSYPHDPGLFCPFLLNVKHLEKGEALYLSPGTLHAYVMGNGIELMSASDNVLRGGLTNKKVDVKELMKVTEIKGKEVEKVQMLRGTSGRMHLLTPTEEFHLMVLSSGTYEITDRRSIELLFVGEGNAQFISEKEKRTLQKGSCHVVAASLGSYTLQVEGMLFIADVPR
ncbi:MAG: mannose-6-phosphate isomerase, class I [Sphaerochaeta sp.]|nr:mannose-6-phosphate isomerase, class I [Sphaerochaeta sp.]